MVEYIARLLVLATAQVHLKPIRIQERDGNTVVIDARASAGTNADTSAAAADGAD